MKYQVIVNNVADFILQSIHKKTRVSHSASTLMYCSSSSRNIHVLVLYDCCRVVTVMMVMGKRSASSAMKNLQQIKDIS